MKAEDLSLRQRILATFIYSIILILISGLITSDWVPSEGGKGLWFFSAMGLFFFTHLSSPIFIAPRDALANSFTSALLLATTSLQGIGSFEAQLEVFRWIAFSLAIIASLCALISILTYSVDTLENPKRSVVSKFTFQVSNELGSGPIMFSPLVLISIIGFYQHSQIQQLWLLFLWSILIFIQPIELVLRSIHAFRQLISQEGIPLPIGKIQRIDHPNIIRVSIGTDVSWDPENIFIVHLPGSKPKEILPLFKQIQDSDIIGTGICHRDFQNGTIDTDPGKVYSVEGTSDPKEILSDLAGGIEDPTLVGFVVENSNLSGIWFEVAADCQLGEGWLVYLILEGKQIYYQIIEARTKEETFAMNPRGTHIVYAEQLGVEEASGRFQRFGWLPSMNCPVFLVDPVSSTTDQDQESIVGSEIILGNIPNSNKIVKANFNDMLAYHTAVLGVTGTGKTELAFDLIRRAIEDGTKIFCVDCTGEYHIRLSDVGPVMLGLANDPSEKLQQLLFKLETSKYGTEEKKLLFDFLQEVSPSIQKQVDEFLKDDETYLAIFELTEIANTKASLRVTELYLSSIFEWARNNRVGKKILLVLEEAHTVVPETNFFGFDRAETGAVVGRMAQIALQGRKYRVGILLITQRTALVSKSLLSQCNTVITFAMHDKTGLEYLRNVFSTDYIKVIPNLKFLQAVGFGKAVQSDRPIMFEVPFVQEKNDASNVDLLKASDGDTAIASTGQSDRSNDPVHNEDEIPF